MTTVEILPIFDAEGDRFYRAVSGGKRSVGKTAGEALDALTAQLEDTEFNALIVIRNTTPDSFFSAEQQAQLSTLMALWRQARDQGTTLPSAQQAELDELVEAELKAATARTMALMSQSAG
ncbi:MAG: hypothetical protein AAFP03_08115 [Cyanobacteria bacterium J06598_3]